MINVTNSYVISMIPKNYFFGNNKAQKRSPWIENFSIRNFFFYFLTDLATMLQLFYRNYNRIFFNCERCIAIFIICSNNVSLTYCQCNLFISKLRSIFIIETYIRTTIDAVCAILWRNKLVCTIAIIIILFGCTCRI